MKALVLGGGSIKGSFQAGAIDALLKAGFKPFKIFGVSVGSLNGVFLADRAGRYNRQGISGLLSTMQFEARGTPVTLSSALFLLQKSNRFFESGFFLLNRLEPFEAEV